MGRPLPNSISIPQGIRTGNSKIFACSSLSLHLARPSSVIKMVVIHAESSSSSATHKKNRRKLRRKSAQSTDAALAQNDVDEAMDDRAGDITEVIPKSSQQQTDQQTGDDDEVMIDTDASALPAQSSAPAFPPLPASAQRPTLKSEMRRIPIPPHRMTPLKKDWVNIFSPLTEMLQLQVRMNVQRKCVEIRVSAPSYGTMKMHLK